MATVWDRTIRRWNRLNARFKTTVDGSNAPTENDEYFIYQILVGTWPAERLWSDWADDAERDAYLDRIDAYLRKAMREAKFRTSWTNPNVAYEDAAVGFVRSAVGSKRPSPFVRELRALAADCARVGAISSLAQTALKLTVPGVPDIYQGCELWDLSLVDPDNRRPVDYDLRRAEVARIRGRVAAGESDALARELLATWPDGRVKLYLTWHLLQLRRERAGTFLDGSYVPLATTGPDAARIVAFAREDLVVVTPRLALRMLAPGDGPPALAFDDETIRLPEDAPRAYIDRLTGARFEPETDAQGAYLRAADVLHAFPVAVLVPS